MDAGEYRGQLQALLPQGKVWSKELATNLSKLLHGIAEEFARIDAKILDLIEEGDPRTTTELLVDWERVAGLPGPCAGLAETLQGRRDEVVQKLTTRGGQSRQFFIDVGTRLGFTITITEFKVAKIGATKIGEKLYRSAWTFAWQVNGPLQTIRTAQVGQSQIGEPLRSWGNTVLECVIGDLKPAHTTVIFAYA
ncbi:MAG: YmfQ family protein [Dehalococcoidia bacterium]